MSTQAVRLVSECFVKPHRPIQDESNQICYLTPWDIKLSSYHYIQKGLLFKSLQHFDGAIFIYATLDMTISDILSPVDVPLVVQSLFDHHKAVNHDGHTMLLLSIQVTELVDGVFLGCSMNHAVGDVTSYWNFFNTWSQIFQYHGHETDIPILHQPIHHRWFPEGCGPLINLPFKHHDEFINRYEAPESIAKLKAEANMESKTTQISSTSCNLVIDNRSRMEPPLPQEYFGNSVHAVSGEATARELLENDLGWAAWKLPLAFPWFNMNGSEFGMGKAVAVRSGYANKFDGKVKYHTQAVEALICKCVFHRIQ
ncbi:hypothetical protein AAZX31_04G039900 [Glycine max]|uniref:Uncharacterized protein n=1 Tax=Glycine max TaxID=3847 RepID=K7KHZ8_SOYBN|nr:hypothetical protein GLYMA_04G040500v4 [Glycine max]